MHDYGTILWNSTRRTRKTRVELEALNMIGEEEACYIYNVDSKSEIVKIISEDIEALEREVEYLTPKIYEPEYDY